MFGIYNLKTPDREKLAMQQYDVSTAKFRNNEVVRTYACCVVIATGQNMI